MKYTLNDIHDILFAGYDYKLPQATVSVVNNLAKELGVTLTSSSVGDESAKIAKRNSFSSLNNVRKSRNTMEIRESVKQFKATILEKKEGVDIIVNDIRVCLNKISSKNYEVQRDAIFENINKVLEDTTTDNTQLIINSILDIASSNKFYSELYATLYKELTIKFPIFSEDIQLILKNYVNSISKIVFVDSNTDYDKYCDNNKLNDKRKAIATFMINLMKQNCVDKKEILSIILKLEDLVMEYVDKENKIYEVEEITENIFIFVTLSVSELNGSQEWDQIISNIKTCSQYKVKEHLSMSSRAVFKFMDILDKIK